MTRFIGVLVRCIPRAAGRNGCKNAGVAIDSDTVIGRRVIIDIGILISYSAKIGDFNHKSRCYCQVVLTGGEISPIERK